MTELVERLSEAAVCTPDAPCLYAQQLQKNCLDMADSRRRAEERREALEAALRALETEVRKLGPEGHEAIIRAAFSPSGNGEGT
jgi:hypothetical protein